MDFLIGSRCLAGKLVARNIDDFKSSVMILFIHFFELFVLRSEAAAGCCIDDKHNLAFEILQ